MKKKTVRVRQRISQRNRRATRRQSKCKRQKEEFQLIDGNFSYFPVAYCEYHKGWLTPSLARIHRCQRKHCPQYNLKALTVYEKEQKK